MWATDSADHADYFARSSAALGGEAVVFRVDIDPSAVILDARGRDFDDIDEDELDGVDIIILDGEAVGATDYAIIGQYAATFAIT